MLWSGQTLEDRGAIERALGKGSYLPARQVLLEVKVGRIPGDAVGQESALGIECEQRKSAE